MNIKKSLSYLIGLVLIPLVSAEEHAGGIFGRPIFSEMILPFLLVFVLVFAVLQKTKVLGEGKARIDALIALAIALMLILFPQPRDLIVGIMPWLAVGLSVLLVFFLLYGFVVGDLTEENAIPNWMKYAFMGISAVFVIGVVAYVSGFWDFLTEWVGEESEFWGTVIMIVVIGVGLLVALLGGKNGE